MTGTKPILLWFRNDLRLADHMALQASTASGAPIVPVYIWSPSEAAPWAPGAGSRWWLHHSLERLDAALQSRGSRLILRQGTSLDCLRDLVRETGAAAVHCSRSYEPAGRERDRLVTEALEEEGVSMRLFPGVLLAEPERVHTKSGTPFKVFTPFWRHLQAHLDPAPPLPAPSHIGAPRSWPDSVSPASLGLLPGTEWAGGMAASWTPGEAGARQALDSFLDHGAAAYDRDRDLPGTQGTSRLSPYLHHGEVSLREVWHEVQDRMATDDAPGLIRGGEAWLRQLGWRDFAHHLLYHFPHTHHQPLRPEFEDFPWRDDPVALKAWQCGQTGYPLVDAGMRELRATGWMHNRVRMVVASFLVKHLLIPWQRGAEWFWEHLVDADLANNTLGWQWTAGCGADAAPFFRIFNPTAQADRFAGDGVYVRRWVPELAALPDDYLHQPWAADSKTLVCAGVDLGKTYPRPMVDHKEARLRALDALRQTKEMG